MSDDPFIPYAVIETANWPPTSMLTIWAIGAAKLKRIDFDLSQPEDTFIDQALAGLQAKLDRYGGKELPSFGRPVSIVINLEPNRGIRIDLDGTILDKLDWTMTIGSASMTTDRGTAGLGLSK
ncbi:hypothetical protein ABEV34_16005 [Methylorubrum rhodesianum]|uniref:hypothetical protein n=1 Tax=Methylorubrum TaxID=2282523 RepID=UPI00160D66B3|nr:MULTISPECIES: hypothetical protein [Methylorubrum]MBB5765201.1 hypothetical protein [Methylorubrum rhodesianum]MBI1687629.1 hypothetical protein [Methylorubrum sp. DB1722]